MAGEDSTGGFDADEFRTSIRAVMLLGLAEDQAQRPIFLFPRTRTYANDDKAGQPFDWGEAPTTDTNTLPGEPKTVKCGEGNGEVLCAFEAAGGRGGTQSIETPFGDFDTERLVITMLDVDFAKVDGFDRVQVGDALYRYQFEEPRGGLYDVTVHQLIVAAVDEN